MGFLAVGIASGFWAAFVAWKYWTWFAVPAGLPPLGYWHIGGLLGGACLLRIWLAMDLPDVERPFMKTTAKSIALAIYLAGGAFYQAMMP